MQVTSGYSWKGLCTAAERERDPKRLGSRIREAEQVLCSRSQEIRGCSDGQGEVRAIREASDRLRFIKAERLEPSDR
jgi:hypothetical protein